MLCIRNGFCLPERGKKTADIGFLKNQVSVSVSVFKIRYQPNSSVKCFQCSVMSINSCSYAVLQGYVCKALLPQKLEFALLPGCLQRGTFEAKYQEQLWYAHRTVYYLSKPKCIVQFSRVSAHSQTYQPSAILEPSARPRVTAKSSLAVLHLKDVNHASLAAARTSLRQSGREALHASEQGRDRGRITTTDIKNIH